MVPDPARAAATLRLALVAAVALAGCVTRPADGPGPEVQVDGRALDVTGDAGAAERDGLDRLARGDYQGALVSLRLAEDREPSRRDWIRVEQARALHLMGMDEAALSTLDRVLAAQDADGLPSAPARRALALAGAVNANRDALVIAEDLLRRALDGDDEWPGAARARADLGVVLLRMGDDERGVAALRAARELFLARGDDAGARTVEENLAAWATITGAGTVDR